MTPRSALTLETRVLLIEEELDIDRQPTRLGRIEFFYKMLGYKVGVMAAIGGVVGGAICAAVVTVALNH